MEMKDFTKLLFNKQIRFSYCECLIKVAFMVIDYERCKEFSTLKITYRKHIYYFLEQYLICKVIYQSH